jgi:hypothetical protein
MELRGGLGPINIAITSSDTKCRSSDRQPGGVSTRETCSSRPRRSKKIRRRRAPRTISITQPAGFTTPHDFQAVTATVNAPPITLGNANVGRDLQTTLQITLGAVPPSRGHGNRNEQQHRHRHGDSKRAVEGSAIATFTQRHDAECRNDLRSGPRARHDDADGPGRRLRPPVRAA